MPSLIPKSTKEGGNEGWSREGDTLMISLSDGLVGLLFGSGGALTPRDLNRPGGSGLGG